MEFVNPILELVTESSKRNALNYFDSEINNTLMYAASRASKEKIKNGEARRCIEFLIELGADKNIMQDAKGLSALGGFLKSKLDIINWHVTFSMNVRRTKQHKH